MDIINKTLKALFWRAEYYGAIVDGGVPTLYNGLTSGLLRLGHECIFASSGRLKLHKDIRTEYIPYSKLFRNLPEILCLPYNRKSINAIRRIIDKEQPDFLFQHHHDFLYGGTIVKKKTGIPFLLHCDSVEYWVKKNWGKLYFGYLLKTAEEIQWEHSDAIFVISEALKQQLIEFGVDAAKIIVNPNGTNTDILTPDISGDRIRKKYNIENKFVCGFSGTFGQWHGIDVLAKSIKYIKDRIPNIFFLMVGDGVLRPQVEDVIKQDNVGRYAHITGLVPYEEIPEYLAACDLLLTPCVNNEDNSAFINSPIKLFEYLSMGKPVIATPIGQQADVIIDKQNGIFCESGSAEDLAEKIYLLYKEQDLCSVISANARQDAVSKYDWKFNAQRIVDAYYKIIEKRK